MTAQSYTHIRVSVELHVRLKTLAQERNVSLNRLISESVNTMLTRNSQQTPNQTNPNQTVFSNTGRNMAGPAGIEPATPDLEGRCAFRWPSLSGLRHGPCPHYQA